MEPVPPIWTFSRGSPKSRVNPTAALKHTWSMRIERLLLAQWMRKVNLGHTRSFTRRLPRVKNRQPNLRRFVVKPQELGISNMVHRFPMLLYKADTTRPLQSRTQHRNSPKRRRTKTQDIEW